LSDSALAVSDGEAIGEQAWDAMLLARPEGNLLQSWTWGSL